MAISKANRVPSKKVQKAADNAEAARNKATAKAAKEMVKAVEKAVSSTQFMWTEATLFELLAFIKMLKDENNKVSRQPGFTTFTKIVLQNKNSKEVFPLLAKLENNTLM
ncbi:hypothetical protein VP01_1697g3 [Puccinia sorghi]|uniref:Uncharacterized protein n=1 Tax=Puccinia sorghi TaxID=27349 RepID=A0A0L6VFN0_9BASI|nr:hypothetical protein VP01_1697g3 [Puccinia sorghi]